MNPFHTSESVAYNTPNGSRRSAPPHASAIVYLGSKEHEFVELFSGLGYCVSKATSGIRCVVTV